MNLRDINEIIQNDLPISIRSHFVPAVKRGYDLTNRLISDTEFLQWPVGFDFISYIRRIAVEFELKRLIDAGIIPIRYEIALNSSGNYHHLELITKQCRITLSQVRYPYELPRKACFRENHSIRNQLTLPLFEEDSELVLSDYFYLLLTYGYNGEQPNFVCLGAPEPYVKGWIVRINLMQEPYLQYDEEKPEVETLVTLKQHIKGVLQIGT